MLESVQDTISSPLNVVLMTYMMDIFKYPWHVWSLVIYVCNSRHPLRGYTPDMPPGYLRWSLSYLTPLPQTSY